MKINRHSIALLFFATIILAFTSAYAGNKLANSQNEKPLQTNSNNEQIVIEGPDHLTKVAQAYSLIQEHYLEEVEEDELVEGAIHGMIETLDDPYSAYMDVKSAQEFNEHIESSFEGIGAEVSLIDDIVTIVAPIKESPAEEAGLRPNDQILKIDEKSIEGLDLNEAVDKIRGEKGTEVVLEILRPGVSEPFDVTVIRDEIPIETVYPEIIEDDEYKTGIIEITTFSENTGKDFATELEKMESDGIDGLIIDVRGNPGGLLNVVEEILQHFVPKDIPYVQTEDQQGNKHPLYSTLDEKKDYPISVLIDEGSASASEILAVALKEIDYDVVGQPSHGKGTVQQAVPLGDGSTLKLTFYKWLSPMGTWIHETGVKPTIEVSQPDYFYTHPVQIEEPFTIGQENDDIKNVQQMLDGLGYDIEKTDGKFNEATKKAVEQFQKDHNLTRSGEINKETAEKIELEIIEKIRNRTDDPQLEKALKTLYE